jgi:hypothetical protein
LGNNDIFLIYLILKSRLMFYIFTPGSYYSHVCAQADIKAV